MFAFCSNTLKFRDPFSTVVFLLRYYRVTINIGPENEQQINNLQFITPYMVKHSHEVTFVGDCIESVCTVRIGRCSPEKQTPRKMESSYARFEVFHDGNNAVTLRYRYSLVCYMFMDVSEDPCAPIIGVGLPRGSRILRIGLHGVARKKAVIFEVLLQFTRKW
jgi:hypothetical protein